MIDAIQSSLVHIHSQHLSKSVDWRLQHTPEVRFASPNWGSAAYTYLKMSYELGNAQNARDCTNPVKPIRLRLEETQTRGRQMGPENQS